MREGYRLTAEAEHDRQEFTDQYGRDGDCHCHLGCAPCSCCTHPGNPMHQVEDDAAWEPDPDRFEGIRIMLAPELRDETAFDLAMHIERMGVTVITTPNGRYRDPIGLDLASGPDWSIVQPWPPTSAPIIVDKTLAVHDVARIVAAAMKRQRRADKRRRIAQRLAARGGA